MIFIFRILLLLCCLFLSCSGKVVFTSSTAFLQSLTRTSVKVVFETTDPATAVLNYGETPDMLSSIKENNEATHHVIKLSQLKPATKYYYKAIAGRTVFTGEFNTIPDNSTPYKIVVYGDTRTEFANHKAVADAAAREKAGAIFHVGDLINSDTSSSDWADFFKAEANTLPFSPFYPVLGNHEGTGDNYLKIFEMPYESGTENYYGVRYATSYFLMLDIYNSPFDINTQQYNWIENTLKQCSSDPAIRNIFIVLHHGPYDTCPNHGANMEVRAALVPLFEKYGVNIVFSGHNHVYERGTVNNIKYVVTGAGGAPLHEPGPNTDGIETSKSAYEYAVLEIEGATIKFAAKEPDGNIIDQFVLGDNFNECSNPDDCSTSASGVCEAGESGSWLCINSACIWNCASKNFTRT